MENKEETKTEEKEKTPVEKVTENYEKLKEENDKVEKELLRAEELKAKIAIGGKSDAGQTEVKKTDDEKWAEGAKERYKGTGIDPTPDDTPTTYS